MFPLLVRSPGAGMNCLEALYGVKFAVLKQIMMVINNIANFMLISKSNLNKTQMFLKEVIAKNR
jgi:hypothetical protein